MQFDKLCNFQCTLEEIASFFDCSPDTIENRCKQEFGMNFSELFRQKRSQGRISLRRAQWKIALGGNVTMLIWLGKQYLDQKDKSDNPVKDIPPEKEQKYDWSKLSLEELMTVRKIFNTHFFNNAKDERERSDKLTD